MKPHALTLLGLLGLLSLAACQAAGDAPATDDTGDAGDSGDSGDPGDSGDSGDSGDAGPSASIHNHVLITLTVADRGEGFDLDGDGTADNALAPLGSALDPLLASALGAVGRALVIQVADAESLVEDASVQIALVTASDPDGDPSDNAAGETFSAGPAVDAEGRAVAGVQTALSGGAYTVALLDESLEIGSLELASATPIWLAGALDADAHSGLIGLGVGVDAIVLALEAVGYAEQAALVETLADLDTDEDGAADAISLALRFDAVACGLEP